jgi:alpha/beta superfamily hydrolase
MPSAIIMRFSFGATIMENSVNSTDQAEIVLQPHLYSDANDRMKHFEEIQAIADSLHRPVPDVAQLYEEVLEYLRDRAEIPDFLPVFVSKQVRELCRAQT